MIFIPLGGLIPTLLNSYGLVSGSSIVYLKILSWSPNPPISEKSTFPGSSLIILKTIGSTYLGKTLIIVNVVWSSATLAPTTSLERSIFTFTPTTFLVPLEAFIMSNLWICYIFKNSIPLRLHQSFVQQIVKILIDFKSFELVFFYQSHQNALNDSLITF